MAFYTKLLILFISISISYAHDELDGTFSSGRDGVVLWRRSLAGAPLPTKPLDNSTFILAAERTHRKDPTDNYIPYSGGWNISNPHYWASLIYPSYPLFLTVPIWFLSFGLILLILCCCCCCRKKDHSSYSSVAYIFSLIFLVLFTCAIIAGCAILYTGQLKFHKGIGTTLNYVTGQADLVEQNIRNLSSSLSAAKQVGVDNIFLSGEVKGKIDVVVTKLNNITNVLSDRTTSNAKKIQHELDSLHKVLLTVVSVMLVLALLGLLFTLFGLQFLMYILVIIGWIIVTIILFLAGLSLVFHNAVGDACYSMKQWVDLPHEHTALDDILPCVDPAAANESLYQSKDITFQLVKVVNEVLVNISNVNYPAVVPPPLNYNQSGPLLPALCNPYLPDMRDRECLGGEVDFENATMVWQGYVCDVSVDSGSEICKSEGRLTPNQYGQMKAAVNVTHGLNQYSPFLTHLIDCGFVRETFHEISTDDCPGLNHFTKMIYIGLTLVSVALMLSLIFWVFFARGRRHRNDNKQYFQTEQ